MNWLKKISDGVLDDLFDSTPREIIKRDPPSQEPTTIELYRGFDADLSELEQTEDGYVLSPHKSEQGVIWFSRNKNDADWRGQWLLAYPLQAIKHFERVYYDDGSHYDNIPDEINNMCNPTENCRFYGGIELPEGWFFSYKVEKHIVCSVPLRISREMLSS